MKTIQSQCKKCKYIKATLEFIPKSTIWPEDRTCLIHNYNTITTRIADFLVVYVFTKEVLIHTCIRCGAKKYETIKGQ